MFPKCTHEAIDINYIWVHWPAVPLFTFFSSYRSVFSKTGSRSCLLHRKHTPYCFPFWFCSFIAKYSREMCTRRQGTVCRKCGSLVSREEKVEMAVKSVGRSLRPEAGPSGTTWWCFHRMCPQGTAYPGPDGVPEVCSRLRWILAPPHTGSNLWLLPSSLVLAASLEVTWRVTEL